MSAWESAMVFPRQNRDHSTDLAVCSMDLAVDMGPVAAGKDFAVAGMGPAVAGKIHPLVSVAPCCLFGGLVQQHLSIVPGPPLRRE